MSEWPSQDLSAHAKTLRAAVKALDHRCKEIADDLIPILEVADSLDALAHPIMVTHPQERPTPAAEGQE